MLGWQCNWGRKHPAWNDDWCPPWGREVEVELVGEGVIMVRADYARCCWRSLDSTRTWPVPTFKRWRYAKGP